MIILKNINDSINKNEKTSVVLGNFDGVHKGHQRLIEIAKEKATLIGGKTLVFSFYPHPQFQLNNNIEIINTFDLKCRILQKIGVDYFAAIPFTTEISHCLPEDFIKNILKEKYNALHTVAGFNFSFGYKGKGKAGDLIRLCHAYGIDTTIMGPFLVQNELVSSSTIRNYLKVGEIKKAAKLLGYYPKIEGKVVEGNQIGRKIGFPTANIKWDEKLIIPQNGVYAVKVFIKNTEKMGVLNIGFKPTVTDKLELTIEVNILNHTENIYGKKLLIEFYAKLRNEMKFENLEALKAQIQIDADKARKILSNH